MDKILDIANLIKQQKKDIDSKINEFAEKSMAEIITKILNKYDDIQYDEEHQKYTFYLDEIHYIVSGGDLYPIVGVTYYPDIKSENCIIYLIPSDEECMDPLRFWDIESDKKLEIIIDLLMTFRIK